jgi:hypothetical protein
LYKVSLFITKSSVTNVSYLIYNQNSITKFELDGVSRLVINHCQDNEVTFPVDGTCIAGVTYAVTHGSTPVSQLVRGNGLEERYY